MRLLTSAIARAVDGRLVGPDVTVDGASVDSRELQPGQLFVPVIAERDGHDFIPDALAAGAAAYLTCRPPGGEPGAGTAIVVQDTIVALAAAGSMARHRLPDRVVGITGSVGKTSVKDLLAAVLRHRWLSAASERSFNNELGVPLTLLGAPDGAEAVVVEMGARGFGHIRDLCAIARPTVGIVTAVSAAHTEMLGSVEGVAVAKSELVEALPSSGTAVLNADDERVRAMATRTPASALLYGVDNGDVAATEVTVDRELRPAFRLRTPWGDADVRMAARGVHQAGNAAGAAAAALAVGAPLDAVVSGLAEAALSPLRMDLGRSPSGVLVLNDCYNANPTSTLAALRSLAALEADRRIAFLGTMAELGDLASVEHRRVAEAAADLGIEVVAVGEGRYGVDAVASVDEALTLAGALGPGDAVLVKGSRMAGLERLAAQLLDG